MYRRCFTHQRSPPHPDGSRRGPFGEPQRSPTFPIKGDEERLLVSPVSIEERRRSRWMAIGTNDDNFYDDIFGGSEESWRRRESVGDDNFGHSLEGKPRSRSSNRPAAAMGSEDRGRRIRSLYSPVASSREEDGTPSYFASELRHDSPSAAARLAWREEAALSRTSSWLQDLDTCGGAASRHALTGENTRRHIQPEAISVGASSKWSIRKVLDDGASSDFNTSPLSVASVECESVVDRRLMSREHQKALEELERAVVLDIDDLDGNDEDEDDDEGVEISFAIKVRGGRYDCGETEKSAAVDEAIAWARERFMSDSGRKAEEQMESKSAEGGRCEE